MSWMPKGTKSDDSVESENAPAASVTGVKVPSYTSTFPFAMSARNRKVPEGLFVIASPVYIAGCGFLLAVVSTAKVDWLKFDPGVHPLMVPSSVANRKTADAPGLT